MLAPNESARPSRSLERDELETLLHRFEDAWQKGSRPSLDDFLPTEPERRPFVLVELAHIDLEWRLKTGEKARAEKYLQNYPELAKDARQAVSLIAREFELRVRQEIGLKPEEFGRRFPQYRDLLKSRLALRPSQVWATTLIDTLRRLRFLTTAQLEELLRIQDQFPDPQVLAHELLRRGWLTAEQHSQIFGTSAVRTVSVSPVQVAPSKPSTRKDTDRQEPSKPPSRKDTERQEPSDGQRTDLSETTAYKAATTKDLVPGGGGYRKIKRLGRGSFGEVWLADAPGGVRVALKIINRPVDHEEHQNELKALDLICGLRHPFLLQTHSHWPVDDQLYIAMELADCSLRDRIKECKKEGLPGVPLDELMRYTRQAAEALDFLHSKNVQHRDVKPENILLVNKYVKLADFGLARSQGSRELASMTVGGTPMYMAPEVWTGKVSAHTDQYALALTYAELRLGRRVLVSNDLVSLMHEHVGIRPQLDPLPPAEQEAIFRAVAKEPSERYPRCMDFVEVLEAAQRPSPPPAVEPALIVEPPPRSWLGVVAALALLTLLAVAVVWWHGVNRETAAPPVVLSYVPPPEWQPVGDAKTQDREGRWFPGRIGRQLGEQRIEMILIPRLGTALPGGKPDLDTYYMMETKVTVGQFTEFANSHPTTGKEWTKWNGDKRLPVREVSVMDAYQFAHWLGGHLPTTDQWEKAAGLYRTDRGEGPFRGKWDAEKKLRIGVGHPSGPLLPEETVDDISPFGCRDMSGNGQEWTRNLDTPNNFVPPNNPKGFMFVLVRGSSFSRREPLRYADSQQGGWLARHPFPQGKSDLSFRIVLEPSSPETTTPSTSSTQVGSP